MRIGNYKNFCLRATVELLHAPYLKYVLRWQISQEHQEATASVIILTLTEDARRFPNTSYAMLKLRTPCVIVTN
jgi:hypothetical protein